MSDLNGQGNMLNCNVEGKVDIVALIDNRVSTNSNRYYNNKLAFGAKMVDTNLRGSESVQEATWSTSSLQRSLDQC